jgi:hypothetical protein
VTALVGFPLFLLFFTGNYQREPLVPRRNPRVRALRTAIKQRNGYGLQQSDRPDPNYEVAILAQLLLFVNRYVSDHAQFRVVPITTRE